MLASSSLAIVSSLRCRWVLGICDSNWPVTDRDGCQSPPLRRNPIARQPPTQNQSKRPQVELSGVAAAAALGRRRWLHVAGINDAVRLQVVHPGAGHLVPVRAVRVVYTVAPAEAERTAVATSALAVVDIGVVVVSPRRGRVGIRDAATEDLRGNSCE